MRRVRITVMRSRHLLAPTVPRPLCSSARRLLENWLLDLTGRPLTLRGTKPALSAVIVAKLSWPSYRGQVIEPNLYARMQRRVYRCWLRGLLVDYLHEVEVTAWDDAHLL